MIDAVAVMAALGLGLGVLLGLAARWFHVETPPLVDAIDGVLPGTNCGACGYAGCRGLAEAMAAGGVAVTACTPGGREVALALAAVAGGPEAPAAAIAEDAATVAFIFEDHCTGCGKCFKRCPTDAIVGAAKQMHTVVTDACIGCDACVAVCPTEAIVLRVKPRTLRTWYWDAPALPGQERAA